MAPCAPTIQTAVWSGDSTTIAFAPAIEPPEAAAIFDDAAIPPPTNAPVPASIGAPMAGAVDAPPSIAGAATASEEATGAASAATTGPEVSGAVVAGAASRRFADIPVEGEAAGAAG